MRRLIGYVVLLAICGASSAWGQTRLEKVLNDRLDVSSAGFWIYNDLELGREAARNSGQPLLITLRCIPCEECVKLDEQLIEEDPDLQPLLQRFVRVRLVSTNGLNLQQFQYDYDQSFAVLIAHPNGTIYGRYGTRSDRTEWKDDVSIAGLRATLEAALQVHEAYPNNREALRGKQGDEPLFAQPEQAPSLAGKFPEKLEFNDQVVKNCIHCHMIGDAQRDLFRQAGKPIPDQYLFQYPHPKAIGIILDPTSRATVKRVLPDSIAEASGLQAGDEIDTLDGQPILSLADLQWVLHHAAAPAQLGMTVTRNGASQTLNLTLPEGWRQQDNLSWRVTSWGLRRMVTGGLVLEAADDAQRTQAGIADGKMALQVTHVGQYGEHAAAKRAGFQVGDLVISFAGRDNLMRETDLLAYGAQHTQPGQQVEVKLLRDGRRLTLELPMQD